MSGFYPFDLLPAAYALYPESFRCARVHPWVGRDDMLSGLPFLRPLALLADSQRALIDKPRALSTGWYCPASRCRARPGTARLAYAVAFRLWAERSLRAARACGLFRRSNLR